MSREALQISFGDPNALEAFAAMLLGERPFDPSHEAQDLARIARELAHDRARRAPESFGPRSAAERAAFRALYGLARERAAAAHPPATPIARETRASQALRLMLSLRHRQRAALALRYVLGAGPGDVAFVLGMRPRAADELTRAGLGAIARASRSKMDVRRHLRSAGATLPAAGLGDRGSSAGRSEPRSVVRLLLAPSPVEAAPPAASMTRIVAEPRSIYGSTPDGPLGVPSRPAEPRSRAFGWRAAAAVAVGAVMVLSAMVVAPQGRESSPAPLAVVPVAPQIESSFVRVAHPAGPAVRIYVVRRGDTLWRIAGRVLGDPYRWPRLWRANAGKRMADGRRFADPQLIRPGWRLLVPARDG